MIRKSFQNGDSGSLRYKTLAVFFTGGVSLEQWEKRGVLERELKPYNALAKELKEILFCTYGGKDEKKYDKQLPQNIHTIPKPAFLPSFLYSFLLPLIRWKAVRRADILKTNQMYGSWAAVFTKLLFGKKLVVRCGYELLMFVRREKRAPWKRWAVFLAEWIAYRSADRIILTSPEARGFVEEKFRVSPRVELIPNYVDTNFFKPLPVRKEARRIVFVGRLEEQKNIFNLLAAFEGLSVTLVIIGIGSLEERLKELAQVCGVRADFKGIVPQEQLPEELTKSELFVLPSFYEGNPKALLEAMACGLPCVGTDVEGIKSVIEHRKNGYLCDTTRSSIRNAVQEVLGDRVLQTVMSENARRTIVEHFDLRHMIERERRVYEAL